ncbi:MAG: hypothetical protein A2X58_00440 [Nitrospirae bacterium GWC2_56_14]|nr:MAG: hypothetical protein A2X58_00440 [Nitrospirae bacterium GWC2_56_14]
MLHSYAAAVQRSHSVCQFGPFIKTNGPRILVPRSADRLLHARPRAFPGYSEQELSSRFAGQGVAGFFQKPFNLHDLRSLLARVLGRPGKRYGKKSSAACVGKRSLETSAKNICFRDMRL